MDGMSGWVKTYNIANCFRKRLKTHLIYRSFSKSPGVTAQLPCHFRHYSRSFCLLT